MKRPKLTDCSPRPARHVPWPEIFKHHISVLEGHLKMLDMVRKHTVEGSGNHRAICAMLDRTRESLRQTKDTNRSFVPPTGMRDVVPIGSSSASMYPGYSPADVQYGEPAREFGEQWTQAKEQGAEFSSEQDGPQYEIGQAKGTKRHRKSIAQIREELAIRGDPLALASKSQTSETERRPDSGARNGASGSSASSRTEKDRSAPLPADPVANEGALLYVVDTKPTPVNLSQLAPSMETRGAKGDGSVTRDQTRKKRKLQEDAAQGVDEATPPQNEPPEHKGSKQSKGAAAAPPGSTSMNEALEHKKFKKRKDRVQEPSEAAQREPTGVEKASAEEPAAANGKSIEQKKSKKRKEPADTSSNALQNGGVEKKSKKRKERADSPANTPQDGESEKKPKKRKGKADSSETALQDGEAEKKSKKRKERADSPSHLLQNGDTEKHNSRNAKGESDGPAESRRRGDPKKERSQSGQQSADATGDLNSVVQNGPDATVEKVKAKKKRSKKVDPEG